MPNNHENYTGLQELIDASLAGTIGDAEVGELEAILRGDHMARRFYLDYAELHTELYLLFSQSPVEKEVISTHYLSDLRKKEGLAGGSPFLGFLGDVAGSVASFAGHHTWAALLLVVVVLGSAIVGIYGLMSGESPKPLIAQVKEIRNCRWAEGGVAPSRGHASLTAGQRLELQTGLAEIVYSNGAKVLLQGPAIFEVKGGNAGFLRAGKLTATAATVAARGYTIETPSARFTDLGTEFGVEVDAQNRAKLAVFAGKVVAETRLADSQWSKPVTLSRDEAMVCQNASVVYLSASRADFPALQPVSPPPVPAPNSAFQRWLAFNEKLGKRSDLVAHYDFQQDVNQPGVLLNRAATGAALNGRIEGAKWIEGRMPGKNALEFKQPKSGVRIDIPTPSQAVTLVAWVKIDNLPKIFGTLVMSDGWNNRMGQYSWLVAPSGQFQVGFFAPESGKGEYSQEKIAASELDRWHQTAVVFNTATSQVAFYLDGKPIGTNAMINSVGFKLGPATIGTWNHLGIAPANERTLDGKIDELMIFQSALGAEEIHKFYEEGKP